MVKSRMVTEKVPKKRGEREERGERGERVVKEGE
jgi:hypothetical protein